jgi:hypothetical protein
MHIIIKTTDTENKERILKTIRQKKQIMYKGRPIKITADFSMETLKARRAWSEVFQPLNENNFSSTIFYTAKLSFKIDGAIKFFHDKQKLKSYMTTKPPVQKIIQGFPHTEEENHERTGNIKPQEKKIKETETSCDSAAHNQILKQQKQLNGMSYHIPININSECQWAELT